MYAWCNNCHHVIIFSSDDLKGLCPYCENNDLIYNIPISNLNNINDRDECPKITKEASIDLIRQLVKENLHRDTSYEVGGYMYRF